MAIGSAPGGAALPASHAKPSALRRRTESSPISRASLSFSATSRGAEVRTTRATHKDGRKLYVDMTFSVVKSADGQVLGSAAMARDATERYLAERARKAAASGG